MSFWAGFEKQAGAARVDRLLEALSKKKELMPTAHKAVRQLDLTHQARGLLPHKETSLVKAIEHAKDTQAKKGFKGTDI